eukprot:scaffold50492_cov84-Phaeocystis_antarctica.AAC.5
MLTRRVPRATHAASSGEEAISTLATAMDGFSFDDAPLAELASQTSLGSAYGVDEGVVCVLVNLLLDHDVYLQAVLEQPRMLSVIKSMIFTMAKDDILAARRTASASSSQLE